MLTKSGVKNAVYQGSHISCTEAEYHEGVRGWLQEAAGEFIDGGDGVRAQIALMEVRRLDGEFAAPSNFNSTER